MFNTMWLQVDYLGKHTFGGIQYVFQHPNHRQEVIEVEHRYFQPDEKANVVSMQIGLKTREENLKLSAAYLHGLGSGRFLFPKELGRENFYVSQLRTWMDGFGAISVYMIRAQIHPNKKDRRDLSLDWRLAFVDAPDQEDYFNNKYRRGSYAQSLFEVDYAFREVLEGLEMRMIYLARYSPQKDLSPSDIFYKSNLHHLSLVLDINF